MKDRRIGQDIRRMLGFLFGCGEHGVVALGPLDVIQRCRLRAWHAGEHDYR